MTTFESELHRRMREGPLFGCAIESALPAWAELAGMIGYDVVWADMEHLGVTFREAEDFCRAVKAGGAWPLLRIRSHQRTDVLHALEAGARLVVVPMVDSAAEASAIVQH